MHVALRLIAAGVTPRELTILDPAPQLLARWRACTAVTSMTHLRSPAVHNLDVDSQSLRRFAGIGRRRRRPGLFAHPYSRPSLELFNAHCDWLLDASGLRSRHVRGWARECRVRPTGVTVSTGEGAAFEASQLVLALGASEHLEWPSWAPTGDPRVTHCFSRAGALPATDTPQALAVVGGGITSAQIALRLVEEGHFVDLISRHALREHQFDSDPGWLGPKYMHGFSREKSLSRRRAMIQQARHRGSVPPEVRRDLSQAIEAGKLRRHEADVLGVSHDLGALRVRLSNGSDWYVDHMVLATGFATRRPGGALVDQLIADANLPCAPCGYPVVDFALRWHPRIRVTGPLAELELGPVARNIAGARHAGERIVSALGLGAKPRRTDTPAGGVRVEL